MGDKKKKKKQKKAARKHWLKVMKYSVVHSAMAQFVARENGLEDPDMKITFFDGGSNYHSSRFWSITVCNDKNPSLLDVLRGLVKEVFGPEYDVTHRYASGYLHGHNIYTLVEPDR